MEKPLTRIKETMTLLRSMMAGEKTNFEGEILRSKGYRQAPTSNQPIYLAGLRPNMLETAAEISDGVILNLFPRSALPKIMEHIAIGAERAGKDPASVEVVCRHMMCLTNDKELGRAAFRAAFGPYYATPVYNKFLAWAGHEDTAKEIAEGFKARDRERTSAAMTDELVDQIALIGNEAECQDLIREYAAGGIHTHVMAPMIPDPQMIENTVMAFSKERFSF
jgi:alkanesulfonate monooxygenase SsuD/methylene tetrahydromethanopterin reductase-like flavin-dependent oxidoreductase (luciferase family)